MVILYEGNLGVYPKEEDIIASAAGENWLDLVKVCSLERDPFFREMEIEGKRYIDFGSWSKFVVIVEG